MTRTKGSAPPMNRKTRSVLRKFSLRDQYKKSWEYIKESKNFIWIVVGLFFLFSIIGFVIPAPSSLSQIISGYIQDVVNQTKNLQLAELISYIFFNNVKSSFFGLILGILLGIFPAFVAVFNGYILGFVSNETVKTNGALILWRLLPHGIFELPAVFISLGMGVKLGSIIFEKKRKFKQNLIDALRVFIFIVVPLLIIAAVIEGSLIILFG